jgi:hypothetical protein
MRLLMAVGWVLPTVLFLIVVLFAPVDVLDRWSALAAFCGKVHAFMFRLLNGVDILRHARSTLFPQVAIMATIYAVFWCGLTTATSLVLTAIGLRRASESLATTHSRTKLFFFVLGSPALGMFCLFAFFCLPGDPGFARGMTTTSRVGYAWMGTLIVLFGCFLIGLWPACVRALFSNSSFRRNNHG